MTTKIKNSILFILSLISFHGIGQIEFVENLGQWQDQVSYKASLPGGAIYIESNAFTYSFYDQETVEKLHLGVKGEEPISNIPRHAFRVHFIGSHTEEISGNKEKSNYYNYFIGDDPEQWAENVRAFDELNYHKIYDKIDLKMYQKGDHLKYDFKVFPGGDPNDILLEFEALEEIYLENGDLHLKTSVNEIIEYSPYAFQFIKDKVKKVECSFILEGNQLHFELGEYDKNYKLIIDPELTFSTYVGSTSDSWGVSATNDSEGNLIGAATTFGTGYPITLGAEFATYQGGYTDVGISKFLADGTGLIYSTYLGGFENDVPHSLICDDNDNIIVFGTTGSFDYPTTAGVFQPNHAGGPPVNYAGLATHPNGCDMFLSKLSQAGTGLIASSFVGGGGTDGLNFANNLEYNYGDLFRGEVIVDENNNITVASVTNSSNFPVSAGTPQNSFGGGQTDGVIFRLNPAMNVLMFGSYLGGGESDAAYSVQYNSSGDFVVAGGTKSMNFPVTPGSNDSSQNGHVDGFIVIINAAGNSIDYGTFLGSPDYDQAYFVQIDENDYVYVYGQTEGGVPIEGDVYTNGNSGQFMQSYLPDLSDMDWSTTFGSSSGAIDISPTAFLVSDCNQIYVSGWGGETNQFNSNYATESSTFGMPITADGYQTTTDGSDFYLAVFSEDAEDLIYGTFFGGGMSNEHVDGGTSKFDKNGSVYQAVCAGCGGNSDFPSSPGAWSPNNPSSNCNLGVFKFDLAILKAEFEIDGPSEICEGQEIQFINNSYGGTDYQWDFGNGDTSTAFEPLYTYEGFGEFEISLIVSHINNCVEPDTAYLDVTILEGVDPTVDDADLICAGGTVQLQGYGTGNAYWLDDPTLSDPTIMNPTATTWEETVYFFVDFNDCEADTIPVMVEFYDVQSNISDDQEICIGSSIDLHVEGGVSYEWSPPETIDDTSSSDPTVTPDETTMYYVNITTPEGCVVIDSVQVEVVVDFPGGNIYPDVGMCQGQPIQLLALDGYSWDWSPEATLNDPYSQTPIASPLDTTTYFVEVTNICGTGVDQVTVNVITPYANAGDNGTICLEQWHPVWAEGGESYSWHPAQFVEEPNAQFTNVSPPESMFMTVWVTDEYGCTASDEVFINVLPLPYVNAGQDQYVDWLDETLVFGSSDGIDAWWTPDYNIECVDCPVTNVWPDESMYYVYHTVDHLGCEAKDSVYIDIFFPIYIPNTFTPNGDGINDVFRVEGFDVRGFNLEIYNRWGELVWQTNDPSEAWVGSRNSGEYFVQDDVYQWIVTYRVKNGFEKLIGHVTVLR